jgi:hypothetical protein
MSGNNNNKAEITLNVGIVSLNVKVDYDNISMLDKMLKDSIDIIKNNEKEIKELSEHFLGHQGVPAQPTQSFTQTQSSKPSIVASSISDIIEIYGDSNVKFVSPKAYDLSITDAIPLLMYALDRSLRPLDVSDILTNAWKKVPLNTVTSRFSVALKPMVVKKDDGGYVLTGSGKKHVEDNIIPKCR